MREQQHKALQEKQKSNKGKTEDLFSDMGLLANPNDGKTSSDIDKIVKPTVQDDSSKLSVSSQAPVSRPLVPPGFVSSVVDKGSTAKSVAHTEVLESKVLSPSAALFSLSCENRKIRTRRRRQDIKTKAPARGSSELHSQTSSTSDAKAEKVLDLTSALQGADHAEGSRLPDASEIVENGEIMGLDFEVTGPKLLGGPPRSTSILEKLFGTAITAGDDSTPNFVEDEAKAGEMQNSNTLQSKFAGWFPEENRKPSGDISSQKPNNLLSLIVGGEKGGPNLSDGSAMGSSLTPETITGSERSNLASSAAETSEHFSNNYVTEAKPAVLTCEDLEQSMLSEIGGDTSNAHPVVKEHHASEVKVGHSGNDIDNQASHHLLSLLQKGIGSKDVASVAAIDKRPDKLCDHDTGKVGAVDVNVNESDGLNSPGKTLTLESLFGTAFMKELHSAQRNTVGSARSDASKPAHFPPAMNENGINHFASNDRISKLDKVGEWLGYNDALRDMELSKQSAEFDSKYGGIDRGMDVTLPEEDSLINLIDPVNAEKSMLAHNSGTFNSDLLPLPSSSSMPADIREKLAALSGTHNDERSMVVGHDPRVLHGLFDMAKPELPYQNLHPPSSSPQLHASQMNHSRPLYDTLDPHPAHLDPRLNFMPPEAVMHRDAPNHQFPANMGHPSFPHPSAGLPGFDHPIPSPILQQMHMAGDLPPHLARGFPGGAPMPPHPSHNNPVGYIQEPNPLQNFPFGQRQPYFGGPGMGPTGPELGVSNNPPEAFQRLLEMELRANPKQMHPFADGSSPSRAMYGHELETGFRYR
ncbi:Hepatocyte growth factor-regulated tyrosine kinase substrate [Bienertia sinuspersici]